MNRVPKLKFAMNFKIMKHEVTPLASAGPIMYISSQLMMTSSNGKKFTYLAFRAGISPVTGEFPTHRPVSRSLDVFFDLHLIQHLSKQWRRRRFETSSRSLWRHCNVVPFSRNPSHQFRLALSGPQGRGGRRAYREQSAYLYRYGSNMITGDCMIGVLRSNL